MRALKQMVKGVLRRGWSLGKHVLPHRLEEELRGYYYYRQRPAAPSAPPPQPPSPALPSWERREASTASVKRVRIGFAGAGTYAQHHLKVLAALEGVEIRVLHTRGGPRGKEVAARLGIPLHTTELRAFATSPEIDAFVLVLPPESIVEVAAACLGSGRPVLMEKPAGVSPADTLRLARIAREHGTFGMVCMNRRYISGTQHGLAALATTGPVRGLIAQIPQAITADRRGGRLSAFDYAHYQVRNSIHGYDFVRFLLGDPEEVLAVAAPRTEAAGAGASFAATLRFPGDVYAALIELWDTPQRWETKVITENAWLEVELSPVDRAHLAGIGGDRTPLPVDAVDREFRPGVYAQDLDFIRAVRAGRRPRFPACLLEDSFRTMALIDAVASGYRGSFADRIRQLEQAPDRR